MLAACLRSSDELTCYLGKQLAAYSDMPLTATHAAHTYSQRESKLGAHLSRPEVLV